MTEEAHQQWQGRTDGNRWMQRSLIAGFKIIPLRVYYAIVAVVVVFYMILSCIVGVICGVIVVLAYSHFKKK